MTDQYGRPASDQPPAHPEPDPRLRDYPPPTVPSYPYGGPPAPAPYGSQPLPPYPGQQAPAPYPGPPSVPYGAPYPTGYAGPPFVGHGYAMAPWTLPPLPVLPTEPRRYSQLLRGPRYRWWKPVLTILLGLALFVGFSLVSLVPPLVAGLVTGVSDLGGYLVRTLTDLDNLGPVGFVAVNLSLIVLIPTAMLSTWIVHRVRPRYVSSVTGGIRWRWLLRCLLVVVPIWVLYVGLTTLVERPVSGRPDQWVALLVIVLLTTPLQAAGEEYLFRGWIMQNVGAWFARPVVGLVVSTVVSTVTFSAAHGSPDIWILGSIGCLAVAACLATWRTGGLEAGIAMHATNNILVFFVTLFFGGWQDAFVGADTKGTFVQFLLSVVVHGIALALIWWQAGRHGVSPLSIPAAAPVAFAAPPLPATTPAEVAGRFPAG